MTSFSCRANILSCFFLLISFFSSLSRAIPADSAYHRDYHHALIGTPLRHSTFFFNPSSPPVGSGSRLYSISKNAAVGAVDLANGTTLWRQHEDNQDVHLGEDSLLLKPLFNRELVIGAIGDELSAWLATNGRIAWRRNIAPGSSVVDIQGADDVRASEAFVLAQNANAKGSSVSRYSDSGNLLWNFDDARCALPPFDLVIVS